MPIFKSYEKFEKLHYELDMATKELQECGKKRSGKNVVYNCIDPNILEVIEKKEREKRKKANARVKKARDELISFNETNRLFITLLTIFVNIKNSIKENDDRENLRKSIANWHTSLKEEKENLRKSIANWHTSLKEEKENMRTASFGRRFIEYLEEYMPKVYSSSMRIISTLYTVIGEDSSRYSKGDYLQRLYFTGALLSEFYSFLYERTKMFAYKKLKKLETADTLYKKSAFTIDQIERKNLRESANKLYIEAAQMKDPYGQAFVLMDSNESEKMIAMFKSNILSRTSLIESYKVFLNWIYIHFNNCKFRYVDSVFLNLLEDDMLKENVMNADFLKSIVEIYRKAYLLKFVQRIVQMSKVSKKMRKGIFGYFYKYKIKKKDNFYEIFADMRESKLEKLPTNDVCNAQNKVDDILIGRILARVLTGRDID